jgi:hypothetical protein
VEIRRFGVALLCIGLVAEQQGEDERAMNCMTALQIEKAVKSKIGTSLVLRNMGMTCIRRGSMEKRKHFLKKI